MGRGRRYVTLDRLVSAGRDQQAPVVHGAQRDALGALLPWRAHLLGMDQAAVIERRESVHCREGALSDRSPGATSATAGEPRPFGGVRVSFRASTILIRQLPGEEIMR